MSHTSNCVCGDNWRFEATDLSTGRVKAVLHPISSDWENKSSEPGQGSLLLPSRSVSSADIWPHDTGIYISQIVNGERRGHWAGITEAYNATSSGTATVGIRSIDDYLNHRVLADDDAGEWNTPKIVDTQQTKIAEMLVNEAVTIDGIPLVPVVHESKYIRTRTYNFWEFKNIGEAIKQLTEVINGVQYYLSHKYNNGFWSTEIHFVDKIGEDRNVHLRGDIEGATYSISVDAKDHATWVYALGEGSEADQLVAVAYDSANIYPRYVAVPSWADVSILSTLEDHAKGYITDYRDPISTISMTIPGLIPNPDILQVGDRVRVSFDYGLAYFDGFCTILSIAWSLQEGSPVTRSLTLQPEIRPSTSVRTTAGPNSPGGPTTPGSSGIAFTITDPDIVPAGIAYGGEGS